MLTDEDLSQISGDVWSAVLGLQLKLLGEVLSSTPTLRWSRRVTGGVGFRVVIPGARVRNRVGFICSGQPLVVSLLQQSDRQANSAPAAGDAETIPLS